MKIAIVNDTLEEFGGAERVARVMLRTFPGADFHTLFAAPWIRRNFFPELGDTHLYTHWPWLGRIATHSSFIQMVAPLLYTKFDLTGYDAVITNPSHLMSNMVRVPGAAVHIEYIHSIPKNLYGLLPETPLQKLTGYDRFIRPVYDRALKSTPFLLTSSEHMRSKIRARFGVSATVLPPPVHIPRRYPRAADPGYYLCVSRLDRDKHLELAVTACTRLNQPLVIVGKTNEPRYETYLKRIAGPTVRFLGFRTDTAVRNLYRNAKAFLFPSREEDFGIAPLEALAHGVPVIAFHGGGAKETLIEGKTGTFFRRHDAEDLAAAMRRLSSMNLRPKALHDYASGYGEARFSTRLTAYVNACVKENGRLSGQNR